MSGLPEPEDAAPGGVRTGPVPVLVQPGTGRTVEQRLEKIVAAIQELASLRFSARAPVGPDGDIVDAVAAGVNALGEELEAAFNEIERRVADRTAELSIANRELDRRALHDDLTGLPNRAAFWEHLSHRLALASRRRAVFAVLFVDLDDLKSVNDSLGHAAGDALLVAERLSAALSAPYVLPADERSVSASIGVAIGPQGHMTADELVAAADAAMYDAKQRGGGRCALYGEHLRGRRGQPRHDPPS